MSESDYTFRVEPRGEEIVYTDAEGEVWIDRSASDMQQLHCNSIAGPRGGAKMPFPRRLEIIVRLCDFLHTKKVPARFIIDERDPDRPALEMLVANLAAQGHKVSIGHTSAEQRERDADAMFGRLIKLGEQGGKTFSLDGMEIKSGEDYERWKRQHKGRFEQERPGE